MTELAIAFPLKLLQALRLAHAVAETIDRIRVAPEDADKFAHLDDAFGLPFDVGHGDAPRLERVEVDHQQPRTAVGTAARPLIFPRAVIDRCERLMQDPRPVNVSFCGLITPSRRSSLEAWTGSTLANVHEGADDGRMRLAFRAVRRHRLRQVTDVEVWSSKRGRTYPGKAWDEEYFALLARSRFVLCPPGDFVWTYRFFEAALCGALPVVEEPSPIYDGFVYHTMADGFDALRDDQDAVRANRALAIERLTVPAEELRAAALAAAD